MLQILMAGLEQRAAPSMLGFYGDHLPSLPLAYGHFGFEEPHADYVVWPGEPGGPPGRRDLPAHRLGAVIVDALLGTQTASGSASATEAAGSPALDPGLPRPALAFQARGQ
jgi:hypothetical protein